MTAPQVRAQQPWSEIDSPTTRTLWGIVHGAAFGETGQFVAVGEGGTIITSPDGLTWTLRTSGTDKWLLGVTWSRTLRMFVVVGDGGTILASPDGIAWTARNSGTANRLNSVAWSPKRFTEPDVFLAVGENGTALTSSDLVAWTPRPTSVTGWLRGIATLDTDVFVVTGQDGTILTTYDAGENFVRRASGTTRHLDAVTGRSNARYDASGTNFVLTHTADSGRTWTLDRTVNTDGRENGIVYNGLVWFNGALVAVGDQGRIIDEAGRPWATADPLFAGWRAVAASPDRVVAVGTSGAIASAPIDPNLALEHDIAASFLADTILLTATKRRESTSSGYTIQWTLNGEPIAGANGLTLRLDSIAGARNGTYTFTATARDGTARFSTSIILDPQPNPPALGLIDTTFRPALSGPPGPIALLPDGRMIVAGRDPSVFISDRRLNGPVRLLADGSVDPTFAVADGMFLGSPQSILVQPDGRIVVIERSDGTTRYHRTVRLNADGSVDPAFKPDPLLVISGDAPTLLADGRWLSVERQAHAAGFAAVLHRFHADGSLDANYGPVELMTGTTGVYDDGRRSFFSGPRAISTHDVQNHIYLGVQHGDYTFSLGASGGTTRLFRLGADGTPEAAFTPRDVGPLTALAATPAGLMARTSLETWSRLGPTIIDTSVFRLTFDGGSDRTYRTRNLRTQRFTNGPPRAEGLGHDFDVLSIRTDGAIIARALGHLGHFGLVRLDASGELDRNFNAEFGADSAAITELYPLANGQILVAGTFRSLLGVGQPYLARIAPNTRAATTHLSNVSIRARTGGEAGPLIAGYVTRGGETSVLARGAGPSLGAFGVAAPLPDPQLALFAGAAQVSGNDDWESGPAALLASAAARLGAFPFSAGGKDAALYATLPAGAFTVQVAGKGAASGVTLAELYHAGAPPTDAMSPRVINFSVRTVAGTAEDTLIAGFTVAGDNTRNLLIRALGPGLGRFGIVDSLPDPVLTLFRGEKSIAMNDDWAINTDAWLTLSEAFAAAGAFPLGPTASTYLPTAEQDAALLISLVPGSYTVQVTGKADATGVALLEIYEVP